MFKHPTSKPNNTVWSDYLEQIFLHWEKEKEKLPYFFVLLHEVHPNENDHSRVLKRLLEYPGPHRDYPFLVRFLQDFVFTDLTEADKNLQIRQICNPNTPPHITFNENFIDIAVTSTDFGLIIENKIQGAGDQDKQLETYIRELGNSLGSTEKVWAIYLTWDGTKKPGETSLTDKALQQLNISPKVSDRLTSTYVALEPANPIRFIELNYQNDLISWFENALLKEIPLPGKDTLYLFPHLQVYIDHLKYRNGTLLEEQHTMTEQLLENIFHYEAKKENKESFPTEEQKFKYLMDFKNTLNDIREQVTAEENKYINLIHDDALVNEINAFTVDNKYMVKKADDHSIFQRFYLTTCNEKITDCDIHLEIGLTEGKNNTQDCHVELRFDVECNIPKSKEEKDAKKDRKTQLEQQRRNEEGEKQKNVYDFFTQQKSPVQNLSKDDSTPYRRLYFCQLSKMLIGDYTKAATLANDIKESLKQKQDDIHALVKAWYKYAETHQAIHSQNK